MINLKPINDFLEEMYKDFDISKFNKFYLLFELLLNSYERDIDFTSFVEDYVEKNNLNDSEEYQLKLISKLNIQYNYLIEKYKVKFISDCYDFEIDTNSQVHFYLEFNNKIYKVYLNGVYYGKISFYIDEVIEEKTITYKVFEDEMVEGISDLDSFNKYIN